MIEITAKALLAGVLVGAVLAAARSGRADLAGVLVMFPVVTLLGFLFLGQAEGSAQLARAVRASLLMLPVGALYLLLVLGLLRHIAYGPALALATAAWIAAAALVVRWLP